MRKKYAKLLVITAVILSFFLLSRYIYIRNILFQYGDSSFAEQILYNFRTGYHMSSTITDSTAQAYSTIWYKPSEYVCSSDLTVKENQFSVPHLYLISYFLIPFARLINVQMLVALLHAFSYFLPVVILVYFAKKRGVSWLEAGLLGILIIQHPLWVEGLRGQFYFNRLFLPFFALIVYELHARKHRPVLLTLFTLLALSTNEIYGIILFLFYLGSYVIFKKRDRSVLLLALASFLYSIFGILLIQKTFPSVSTQTGAFSDLFSVGLRGFLPYLEKMFFSVGTMKLLFVNFISFGLLLLLKPKYGVFALLFFIPNLLISVGGAEKTGWSTHYHIGYFIPLIWLSIEAYIHASSKKIAKIVLVGTIVVTMMFQYDTLLIKLKPSRLEIYRLAQQMNQFFKDSKKIFEYRNTLLSLVPTGASVSAPEAAMYNLYQRKIYLYPMNIDTADAVILRYYAENPEGKRIASVNYGQQDDNLDVCMFERMKKDRFKVENGTIVGNWIVIKK